MQTPDYVVLVGYFALMIGIGVFSALRIKRQEDFFMGGRSFGKLLQTFAAFGAGTGSSDPVNTGRTTFTSGMSGMWSVMYWLFVTPFYWITGVWYRRMRHLTLGDWFVERYQSKAMGAGYCLFGLLFFMVYGSMLFSAIGKVAAPLMETESFQLAGRPYGIEYLLVPIIGLVVLFYGIAGGLRAAYFTDLVQGLCIIVLSIILIPFGLSALVRMFGDPSRESLLAGFRILHEQLPKAHFSVVGTTSTSEFPLHRIVAVVIINLVGIVVQPHFIATGGGSAKSETSARVGLVMGNFLKRFCTVGWVLTALIALALFADRPELVDDPDKTWGVASRELLGPGLTGLMLACLLAALMSSVDAYMIVGSALVVRNIYAPYINPSASERQYVKVGRWTGVIVVGGSVLISLWFMDVFKQLQLTWVVPLLFAAPFWVGMYWRRATPAAAWMTVAFCAVMFFIAPALIPLIPGMRTHPAFVTSNDLIVTTTVRAAAPSDVARRKAAIQLWQQQYRESRERLARAETAAARLVAPSAERRLALRKLAEARAALASFRPRPAPLELGQRFTETVTTGGKAVFWSGGVQPVGQHGRVLAGVERREVRRRRVDEHTTERILRYDPSVRLKGLGNFQLDLLLYQWLGMDLTSKTNATLSTLELPTKIVSPFLVIILLSLVTKPNHKEALDRYYAKMKTPVDPDPDVDRRQLQAAYAHPERLEAKKLFPGTSLEFQKPSVTDLAGFALCFLACFGIIGLAIAIAGIGG